MFQPIRMSQETKQDDILEISYFLLITVFFLSFFFNKKVNDLKMYNKNIANQRHFRLQLSCQLFCIAVHWRSFLGLYWDFSLRHLE